MTWLECVPNIHDNGSSLQAHEVMMELHVQVQVHELLLSSNAILF